MSAPPTTLKLVGVFVKNRNAGPALFAYATGSAEKSLRVRTMIAWGALRGPALLPRYKALLIPAGDQPAPLGGPIPVAAAWGVARMLRRYSPAAGSSCSLSSGRNPWAASVMACDTPNAVGCGSR